MILFLSSTNWKTAYSWLLTFSWDFEGSGRIVKAWNGMAYDKSSRNTLYLFLEIGCNPSLLLPECSHFPVFPRGLSKGCLPARFYALRRDWFSQHIVILAPKLWWFTVALYALLPDPPVHSAVFLFSHTLHSNPISVLSPGLLQVPCPLLPSLLTLHTSSWQNPLPSFLTKPLYIIWVLPKSPSLPWSLLNILPSPQGTCYPPFLWKATTVYLYLFTAHWVQL